ncbi:MAG: Hint domain-containing protein, partial [Alphaproteobacteria bacterium]|nr:Hint domain-containing protein [Alphaproteobacteria bacterium]
VGSGNNVYLQQGAVISGGLLTTSGGGLIEVATGQSGSLDGSSQGAITNAGTFLVADSGALFVSGVIDNTGTINLASTGDNTDLRIADGTTLTGGGTVLLSDSSNNRIFGSVNNGNETLTNLNNTIEGAGQFSASNRIAVVNGGTIAATGTNALVMALTTNLSPGLTNQAGGLLLATGSGGLQITTGSVSNLGTVEAKDGSSVTYSSGVTDLNNVSGTLTGGVWEAVASGHGATISVTGGAVTTDAADIILSGPGSVFQAGNGNTFTPIDTSLTTIAAGGELDVLNGRNFTTTNAFTNDGKIVVTGGTFTADGASFLNAGTIAVTNGTLAADGASFSNTGAMSFLGNAGTAAIAGSIGNSTTITASAMAGGEVDLQGTIAGGTVIGTPLTGKGGELSGVTFDGTLDLSGSADSATIAGGITFKGATGTGPALVNLTGSQAALYTSGSETLSNATIDIGSGGPFAASLINDPNGAGSTTLTLGASLLIDQTGALAQINGDGGNNDAIVNMGSIDAGDAGGTLTIGAGGFTNDSTITVTGERLVAGAPGFTNNGSIAVTNGTLAANSTGFSNAGTMSFVGNAGTAAIAGTVGNSGTITASAMGGGEVDLSGAIDGGTVVGMPLTGKGGTLDGVAFDGTLDLSGSGDVATIVGGITFKGAGGSGPALVNLTGAGATLDTVGSETLNNATIDIGSSGTAATLYNDANNAGNTTLTLGPSLLVHQTGANAAISGSNAAGDAIVNQGTIDPASSGGTMTIAANNFTNDGTINLSGDTLDITGTGFTDAGTIENGTVIGTVMAESGTLDAVTLDGTLDLLSTDVEKIAGGIVLNGQDGAGPASINLTGASAALAILGSQTLTNATIDLGGSGGAPTLYDGFGAGGGATLTLGSSLVIDQTGLHGAISGSNGTTGNVIVNMGTIDAGDAGGTLTIGAASFTNDGQMSIGAETVDASGIAITDAGTITLAGGTLTAASLTINAGGQLSGYGTVTDPVNNGTMTASGGLLDITSPVTGTGTLDIAPTGTLELGSTVNGNTVDFLGNPNTGTLEIDDLASNPGGVQTQDFNAPIAGFASGEIIAIGTSHLGNGNALTSASPGAYNATTNTTPLVLYDLITPVATLTLDGNYSGHAFALAPNPQNPSYDEAQEIPCFCTGTMILTPSGEVPVESLRVGDPVVTWNGAARPITWIGQGRTLVTAKNRIYAAPVILRRDALAPGVPHRDLRVTAGHGICLDGVLIPAGLLVNGRTILRDERDQVVEFYHVELADQDILLADGAPAESYRDDNNRGAFEEPVFHNATGPAFAGIGAAPYAPALSDGPQVQHAWRRLAERAGAPSAETLTEEADLHLLADGERVEGERIGGEGPAEAVYCFRLERLPAELRIASRRAVPAELGLGRDWRALGVGLRRIVLRQPGAAIDIAYDAALLDRGFHAAEPEAGLRWTDGDGLIPGAAYAVLDGPFEVQVEVAATLRYPAATDANPAGEVCGQAA